MLAAWCLALLALVTLPALLPGCSGGARSPEELFARGCEAMCEGRPVDFFHLYSPRAQQEWYDAVANQAERMRNNPGARNLAKQYQLTYEEFMALADRPVEVFRRAHQGMERVLVGARIIDKSTDPVNGRDVRVVFETSSLQQFRWTMRPDESGDWWIESAEPVKLEVGTEAAK